MVHIHEDEINLADILNVLWRRKWIMLWVTALVVGLALIYCYIATPKYRIIAQVAPGITGYDQNGNPVSAVSVADIQTWFQNESYLGAQLTVDRQKSCASQDKRFSGSRIDDGFFTFRFARILKKGKKFLNPLSIFSEKAAQKLGSRHIAASRNNLA